MSEVGTGYIIEIKVENDKNLNIDNVDFSIDFYTRRRRSVHFDKADLLQYDGLFYAKLDSSITRSGELRATITIQDPVSQWEDGLRPVILDVNTGIEIGECECSFNSNAADCECFDQGYKVTFGLRDSLDNVPDAPPVEDLDRIYYGFITEPIQSFAQMTQAMIVNPNNFFARTELEAIPRTLLELSEGDKVVILIPEDSELKGYKDNGFNSPVEFNELILGANGQYTVTVNNIRYKIYGELMTLDGGIYIYVN